MNIVEAVQESNRSKVNLDLLYRKYRGICWICRKFCPRDKASRDHIIPESLGGSSEITNLALAHKTCNNKRGNGYREIMFRHYDFDTEREMNILEEHGIMLQISKSKSGGLNVILSKKRENWLSGKGYGEAVPELT